MFSYRTMKIVFVDLKRQLFGDPRVGTKGIKSEIDNVLSELIAQTSFMMGPYLEKFEKEFAAFCQTRYCVGLNSGTDALEFALRCNGITSGEVITIPNSYFVTSSSISQVGARPIFVDVDPKTFNIDVSKLEEKINRDTKAILVTHLYGRPCDMDAIIAIAARHKIAIIEDCAHATGARYKGKRVPIAGTGCFSFFPGKNIGAWGDGGALVTNDPEVARLTRLWRNDGWEEKYRHEILGRKERLDPLQGAVISVKLRYLDSWNAARQKHAVRYTELLSEIKEIQLPLLADETYGSVFHLYTIHVQTPEIRNNLLNCLNDAEIAAGVHYPTP